MAATDLERFSVSTAALSYAPLLDRTVWRFFVARMRGNDPAGGVSRTPRGMRSRCPAGTPAASSGGT